MLLPLISGCSSAYQTELEEVKRITEGLLITKSIQCYDSTWYNKGSFNCNDFEYLMSTTYKGCTFILDEIWEDGYDYKERIKHTPGYQKSFGVKYVCKYDNSKNLTFIFDQEPVTKKLMLVLVLQRYKQMLPGDIPIE